MLFRKKVTEQGSSLLSDPVHDVSEAHTENVQMATIIFFTNENRSHL